MLSMVLSVGLLIRKTFAKLSSLGPKKCLVYNSSLYDIYKRAAKVFTLISAHLRLESIEEGEEEAHEGVQYVRLVQVDGEEGDGEVDGGREGLEEGGL